MTNVPGHTGETTGAVRALAVAIVVDEGQVVTLPGHGDVLVNVVIAHVHVGDHDGHLGLLGELAMVFQLQMIEVDPTQQKSYLTELMKLLTRLS